MNIINIYSQFQETFSVEIHPLDRVRGVVQTFIALSVLISVCLSHAFRHPYFQIVNTKQGTQFQEPPFYAYTRPAWL